MPIGSARSELVRRRRVDANRGSFLKVLGIDPGIAATGYGMVIKKGGKMSMGPFGSITTPADCGLPSRLEMIYTDVQSLLRELSPDVAVVEQLFFNTNLKTAVEVGEARGVIMLACSHLKVRCEEYTPLQVKQAVVGNGNASKEQVAYMVGALLGFDSKGVSHHACDALALALCHLHHASLVERVDKAK